jgi:hypothetical protein
MLALVVIAGLEAVPPAGGHAIIIVGMDYSAPAELILLLGGIVIFGRATEESQVIWADIGEPSGSVG